MGRPSAREGIVQAGLKCLVEKGFNAVGVQDITDTAGVPKGSFYNHFVSKEALGVEIVERYGANQTRRGFDRSECATAAEAAASFRSNQCAVRGVAF